MTTTLNTVDDRVQLGSNENIPWKSCCLHRCCRPRRVLGEMHTSSAQAPLGRRAHWKPPTITYLNFTRRYKKIWNGILPRPLKMPLHLGVLKIEPQNWGYLPTRWTVTSECPVESATCHPETHQNFSQKRIVQLNQLIYQLEYTKSLL
jgi:hypothetical protein